MERKTNECEKEIFQLDKEVKNLIAEASVHRRILRTINNAVRPEDLLAPEPSIPHVEVAGFAFGTPAGDDHGHEPIDKKAEEERKQARSEQLKFASEILKFRDEHYPLGLRHVGELATEKLLDIRIFPGLFLHLTHLAMGQWADFPVDIPDRGPGSETGVVHAAMCHTGKVLFITADETTLLWDPNNTAASTFEDPTNQPHLMPSGYSQLCGHHVFLSSGKLLSVGGGGYGSNSLARAGYVFDPPSKTWARTSNNMSESKWYPTSVALGDERVLVTCGNRSGHMDIYDEATNSFSTVTGDDNNFPNLYPGLHLLPSHSIFYTRTGWGNAGTGGAATNDPQSAYFSFSASNEGAWNNIQNASANRTKGMSVLLLSSAPPMSASW
jgi:hypothetical protein